MSLLGQEICFANRHGQNFCYAKTTSSPCFFGFSNRRIMVKAFSLCSKFTNSLREQLRCRRTFWRFALKTVCDRPVFFGVHTLRFSKGLTETFIKTQLHCVFRIDIINYSQNTMAKPWYFIESFTRFFSWSGICFANELRSPHLSLRFLNRRCGRSPRSLRSFTSFRKYPAFCRKDMLLLRPLPV